MIRTRVVERKGSEKPLAGNEALGCGKEGITCDDRTRIGRRRDTYEAFFHWLYMHCSEQYLRREETILLAFIAFCFLISVGVGLGWSDGAVYGSAHACMLSYRQCLL